MNTTIVCAPALDSGAAEVAQIHVTAGAHVAAGDILLTLETPCVYVDVEAPSAGIVRSLAVGAGQRVIEGGQLLVLGDVRKAMTSGPAVEGDAPCDSGESAIDPEIARIMEESARQAIFEVELEMQAAAVRWSAAQVFARQQLRTLELFMPASNAYIDSIRRDGRAEQLLRRLEAVQEEIRATGQRQPAFRSSLDQLAGLWRRHPFLVGFFGAGLLRDLRRRR